MVLGSPLGFNGIHTTSILDYLTKYSRIVTMGEIIDFGSGKRHMQPHVADNEAQYESRGTHEDEYFDKWFEFLYLYRAKHPDLFPHAVALNNNRELLQRRYNGILADITKEEQDFTEELTERESAEWAAFEEKLIREEVLLMQDGELPVSATTLEMLVADDQNISFAEQALLFRSRYQRYLPDEPVPSFVDQRS